MPKKTLRNLQIGVGFSVMILIVSSIASYVSIQNQIQHRENVGKSRRAITAVKDVLIALVDAETGNRGYQLTGAENYLEPFNRSIEQYHKIFKRIYNIGISDKKQIKRLYSLEKKADLTMAGLQILVNKHRQKQVMSPTEASSGKASMDECRKLVNDFTRYEEASLEVKNRDLNNASKRTIWFIILSALSAIAVTFLFYIRLHKDILRRESLERALKNKDHEMSKRVSAIKEVANRIALGDYSLQISDDYHDDLGDLTGSLNEMAASLEKSFDTIRKSDWKQKGLALLNESLVGNPSIRKVADESLGQLITYGAGINGAIYFFEEGILKLIGFYGLEPGMRPFFELGEGMVGQTFVSKKFNLFNDLKEKDFTVSFASSTTRITSLLLIPIITEGQSIGVLELGAMNNFNEKQIDYFIECSRIIAMAFQAAKSREKEQLLLEETQSQSEELLVQHSELENLNTELEAQTQKLQASEEELRVQQEELMQANAELEERSRLMEEKNLTIAERNTEIQKKVEELALSTKYKSEFLANMSHELRTPLNSILLLSRLMAENPEKNLTDDQIESATVIQSSGSSLLTLIDEILDLAKIESGKMTLEYEVIYIDDIVQDLKNLFNPVFQEKKLQFIIQIDSDVEKTIKTDRLRVDQVLRNLISNALKFTSKGTVGLHIKRDPAQKDFITFSVKDTGIGIAEDKQKIIFEAFQQADGSTRRKFGGTGLGLSISREIAKLLGGALTLKSEINKGSEFSMTIPIKEYSENNFEKTDQDLVEIIHDDISAIKNILDNENSENLKTLNIAEIPYDVDDDREQINEHDKVILIIEDDTNFAKVLVKYAKLHHYKAVVTIRGDQALLDAINYKPQAILLDIQLPVKNGWQVMDELKANPNTKHIPVHMMSALNVRKESLTKGAVDFISKPIDIDHMTEVFNKIEEALKRTPQKVLIIEENAKHASALSYFLSNFNISLTVENNIRDSINALTKKQLDCVIFDTSTLKGDKYQIIGSIKNYKGLENLPIIIFIEQNLSQSEELKIKQYADSIIVKTAYSYQRILDEIDLFLHLVEDRKNFTEDKRSKTLGSLIEVLSGKKILITDDDARNIFSLTKVLETYKMQAIIAMDGKHALQQIEKNPELDVILMDMMMPEMDGYETIRQIRQMPKFTRLPIIAITAKAMPGDRQKCIDAGASDYISKPVDTDQLLSLLRVWLYQIK